MKVSGKRFEYLAAALVAKDENDSLQCVRVSRRPFSSATINTFEYIFQHNLFAHQHTVYHTSCSCSIGTDSILRPL